MTAILHVVLGMTFFSRHVYFFHFLFGLLFLFSLWTFNSLFSLDFYFPFLYGLLFPFSLWTFISFSILFQFFFNSFSILSQSLILDSSKFVFFALMKNLFLKQMRPRSFIVQNILILNSHLGNFFSVIRMSVSKKR